MRNDRNFFNCSRCPAYCCSYPHIVVTKTDIKRLAKHFGMTADQAEKKLTKQGPNKGQRGLRHKKDETFGTICRFVDSETRNCTVYHARPKICREYPGSRRCGYYDFLSFERSALDDPDHIATTYNK